MKDSALAGADVLVTGGSGFIGTYLCQGLQELSARVVNLDTRIPIANNGIHVEGSGTDIEMLKSYVKSKAVVFHLAGDADIARSFEEPLKTTSTNVNGTINVLECLRKYNDQALLELISTSAVYGVTETRLKREDARISPLSPYAASKAAAEIYAAMYARKYGLKVVTFRPFNTYGAFPLRRKDVVSQFVWAVLEGRSPVVRGDGNQRRDLTYVIDTVRIMTRACESKSAVGKVLNIGTGKGVRIGKLARLVVDVFGKDKTLQPIFDTETDPGPPGNICDQTLLRRVIGEVPKTSILEGLTSMRSLMQKKEPERC